MATGSGESDKRFQVRLLDLFIVVLGAAYVFDVARRSRIAWGGGWPDLAHAVGLTVLTLGVTVALVLIVQWVARLGQKEGRAWASAWRVVAVGWLLGALLEVAAVLQDVAVPGTGLVFGVKDTMRLRLISLSAMLGLVGLVLAVAPLRRRSNRPASRPRFGSLPTILFSTAIGLVILALGHGLIPYLVMLALEAVQNALSRAPLVKRPIVFDRMLTASLESLPGLIGCLLTASWVDDDLRAASRDPAEARNPRPWWARWFRAATVAMAGGGAIYVVSISIPRLSPPLAEGLSIVIEPSLVATLGLGFAALAAGFAARGAARLVPDDAPAESDNPPRIRNPWPRRIVAGVVGLFCLELIVAAVLRICQDVEERWYLPIDFPTWMSLFSIPERLFGASAGSALFYLLNHPDDALIAIAGLWLIVNIIGLIAGKSPEARSPMDRVAADPLALRRFFAWWVALATAMFASLPGLAIVAVTLTHYVVRWAAK